MRPKSRRCRRIGRWRLLRLTSRPNPNPNPNPNLPLTRAATGRLRYPNSVALSDCEMTVEVYLSMPGGVEDVDEFLAQASVLCA